eukprot:3179592-Pyramimonas_sp.AAC.1
MGYYYTRREGTRAAGVLGLGGLGGAYLPVADQLRHLLEGNLVEVGSTHRPLRFFVLARGHHGWRVSIANGTIEPRSRHGRAEGTCEARSEARNHPQDTSDGEPRALSDAERAAAAREG